ncbi:MAG: DUF6390 family protein [Candidatus Limnocylindria bacterium]
MVAVLSATAAPSGPVLFGRYAFGPNRLGYCGPDESRSLLAFAAAGTDDGGLRSLARGFEGAYPYLQLIAAANDLADPLDRDVVEAYWLGNGLTAAVRPRELHRSVEERFRPRLTPGAWGWLESAVAIGARPVHAFHVFDVFPKVGLLRGEAVSDVLATIDSCRIRWGRVEAVIGEQLIVSAASLAMVDGRLRLAEPQLEMVSRWLDGTGFVDDVLPGEMVAIHWSWACDRLTPRQLHNLVAWTRLALWVTNRSI